MKRIGVVTLPFNNNYGGYLQAFALVSVLKSFGCEVEVINRRHNRKSLLWFVKKLSKNVAKMLLGRKPQFIVPNPEKEILFKGRLMSSFVEKHIPCSKPLFSSEEMETYCRGRYDVCVAGSDQLWRPDYVPEIENYFFSFIDDSVIKLVSYAASFGIENPSYSEYQRKICGELFAKFSSVSLRENSGFDVIKNMGWLARKNPRIVMDPTMLLRKEDYLHLIDSEVQRGSQNVLCYVLDYKSQFATLVDKVVKETKLSPNFIMDPIRWTYDFYVLPSIEKWLSAFEETSFVVTDSFHGTVFSILFNKPFIVCVNKGRGQDRFYTLLGHFGLLDRIASTENDVCEILKQNIDWTCVNKILEEKRTESLRYLKDALDL